MQVLLDGVLLRQSGGTGVVDQIAERADARGLLLAREQFLLGSLQFTVRVFQILFQGAEFTRELAAPYLATEKARRPVAQQLLSQAEDQHVVIEEFLNLGTVLRLQLLLQHQQRGRIGLRHVEVALDPV